MHRPQVRLESRGAGRREPGVSAAGPPSSLPVADILTAQDENMELTVCKLFFVGLFVTTED